MFLLSICFLAYFSARVSTESGSALASETCNHGQVRLVGGPNEFEGRAEVCLGGEWGRWCRTGRSEKLFSLVTVACKQLHGAQNVTDSGIVGSTLYGESSLTSNINVSCMGTESNIADCMITGLAEDMNCNDVAIICGDPRLSTECRCGSIVELSMTNSTAGLVETCSSRFRAGLCYENFTTQTATVLYRQLGLDETNPGVVVGNATVRYFRGVVFECTGNEKQLNDCTILSANTGGRCSNLLLINCSDSLPKMECSALISTATAAATTTSSSSSTTTTTIDATVPIPQGGQSNTLRTIVVVVCVVLALLLAGSVIIIIVVLCVKRGRSNKVNLEEAGISNINYELSSKPPPPQEVEQRTVHNALYTKQTISCTSTSPASGQLEQPHVYDYAAVGLGVSKNANPQVPQHTLVHSTASTSEHAYSKPATPISTYDRTGNNLGPGSPLQNSDNYSKLNSNLGQDQSYSEIGNGQYSHIDDAHKYSKLQLSDANSKGYSQLDITNTESAAAAAATTTTAAAAAAAAAANSGQQEEQGRKPSLPQPYEVPFSPSSNCTDEEDTRNHAYSTLTVEDGDTGYSKLRVFENGHGTSKSPAQVKQNSVHSGAVDSVETGQLSVIESELEDNHAYESSQSLEGVYSQ